MTLAQVQRIDAHLHLWDLDQGEYAWLGPQHGALNATFTPEQAKAELDSAGVGSAILVQAEDSLRDTEFLLAVADAHPWVAGVVGWVPLDDPPAAERALERWASHPAFCGVRHLVHNDPRSGFLSSTSVRSSLTRVAELGFAFDVPDAWPAYLEQAIDLAGSLPGLTVVIDHLAKPPAGGAEFARWRQTLARAAEQPNIVAKVSGLTLPSVSFTARAVRPAWDAALEFFGPSRLLYGGDWPITVSAGGYQRAWAVYSELIGELSVSEQAAILGGTAIACYQPRNQMFERSTMLCGIDPILTGALLAHLDAMGHSDSVVVVDAHFPAERLAARLVETPGLTSPAVLAAIRSVLPIDDTPALDLMRAVSATALPVQVELVRAAGVRIDDVRFVDRLEFYDRAATAFLIVRTGETRVYGNALLRKGVVPPTSAPARGSAA